MRSRLFNIHCISLVKALSIKQWTTYALRIEMHYNSVYYILIKSLEK